MKKTIILICTGFLLFGCGGVKKAVKKRPEIIAPPQNAGEQAHVGEKGCVKEGGMFFVFEEASEDDRMSCCEGFEAIEKMTAITTGEGRDKSAYCRKEADEAYVCVIKCGDGQCTKGENECNCPDDCKSPEQDALPEYTREPKTQPEMLQDN